MPIAILLLDKVAELFAATRMNFAAVWPLGRGPCMFAAPRTTCFAPWRLAQTSPFPPVFHDSKKDPTVPRLEVISSFVDLIFMDMGNSWETLQKFNIFTSLTVSVTPDSASNRPFDPASW